MPNSNRGSCGFNSSDLEEEYDRPSKSQLKREMTALQKLGEQLVNESADRLKRVPMPDKLRDAIMECQKIRHNEGRRRQLQYVGKIMRSLDEEAVTQINNTLDSWKGLLKADTVLMHAIENQREKLLSNSSALTEFVQQYPAADIQQLRTLIRNAKKEAAENKPPKSYREIYRQLSNSCRLHPFRIRIVMKLTKVRKLMKKNPEDISIGLVSVSDRAYEGNYPDLGIPALETWLASAITSRIWIEKRLIPDEYEQIEKTLHELVDEDRWFAHPDDGGTGPARRDRTPDATLSVGTREMPGFGEQMRQISLHFVPTAILSRQVAVICERPEHASLILNPSRSACSHPPDAGRRPGQGRKHNRSRNFNRCALLYRPDRWPVYRNE